MNALAVRTAAASGPATAREALKVKVKWSPWKLSITPRSWCEHATAAASSVVEMSVILWVRVRWRSGAHRAWKPMRFSDSTPTRFSAMLNNFDIPLDELLLVEVLLVPSMMTPCAARDDDDGGLDAAVSRHEEVTCAAPSSSVMSWLSSVLPRRTASGTKERAMSNCWFMPSKTALKSAMSRRYVDVWFTRSLWSSAASIMLSFSVLSGRWISASNATQAPMINTQHPTESPTDTANDLSASAKKKLRGTEDTIMRCSLASDMMIRYAVCTVCESMCTTASVHPESPQMDMARLKASFTADDGVLPALYISP